MPPLTREGDGTFRIMIQKRPWLLAAARRKAGGCELAQPIGGAQRAAERTAAGPRRNSFKATTSNGEGRFRCQEKSLWKSWREKATHALLTSAPPTRKESNLDLQLANNLQCRYILQQQQQQQSRERDWSIRTAGGVKILVTALPVRPVGYFFPSNSSLATEQSVWADCFILYSTCNALENHQPAALPVETGGHIIRNTV